MKMFLSLIVLALLSVSLVDEVDTKTIVKELKYAILNEDGSLTSKVNFNDIPDIHLGDLLFPALTRHGNKEIMAEGPYGRVLTALQVKELISKMALGLMDLGVKQEDV